jgi:hypothetical protein
MVLVVLMVLMKKKKRRRRRRRMKPWNTHRLTGQFWQLLHSFGDLSSRS